MKKIVVAMSLVSFCAACSAFAQNAKTAQDILAGYPSGADAKVRNEWQYTLKVDEIKAVADYALEVSKTNLVAGKSIVSHIYGSIFRNWDEAPGIELAPEYDAKFSDAGLVLGYTMVVNAPKSVEKWLVTSRGGSIPRDCPAFAQYIRRGIENKSPLTDHCASLNFLAEAGAGRCAGFYDYGSLDVVSKRVLANMPKTIRRRLRDLGRPIVIKDGVNPVQDAIDELSAALNAPRFSGLKEWIAEWFPDYRWIEVKWMSDEELSKFKDDIFYGDIEFGAANRVILRSHLGVDAYNDFVKKFNN